MKNVKLIAIVLVIAILASIFAGCNPNQSASSIPSTSSESSSEMSDLDIESKILFKSSYGVDDLSQYEFSLIKSSSLGMNLFNIYNKTLPKSVVSMDFPIASIETETTGEFSKLDLFVITGTECIALESILEKNDSAELMLSLISGVATINEEFMKKLNAPIVTSEKLTNMNNYLSNNYQFSEGFTNQTASVLKSDFDISSDAYVGAIYKINDHYPDFKFLAFEYETDAQKEELLRGLQFFKTNLLAEFFFHKLEVEAEDADEDYLKDIEEFNSQKTTTYNGIEYVDTRDFQYEKGIVDDIVVVDKNNILVFVSEVLITSTKDEHTLIVNKALDACLEYVENVEEMIKLEIEKEKEEMKKMEEELARYEQFEVPEPSIRDFESSESVASE